jgi:hypothetical protein
MRERAGDSRDFIASGFNPQGAAGFPPLPSSSAVPIPVRFHAAPGTLPLVVWRVFHHFSLNASSLRLAHSALASPVPSIGYAQRISLSLHACRTISVPVDPNVYMTPATRLTP